jgi:hypothetical protein
MWTSKYAAGRGKTKIDHNHENRSKVIHVTEKVLFLELLMYLQYFSVRLEERLTKWPQVDSR